MSDDNTTDEDDEDGAEPITLEIHDSTIGTESEILPDDDEYD